MTHSDGPTVLIDLRDAPDGLHVVGDGGVMFLTDEGPVPWLAERLAEAQEQVRRLEEAKRVSPEAMRLTVER